MTVRQFKNIIKDWPEEDENGEQSEVWIDGKRKGLTSICIGVERLNSVDLCLTAYED